MHLSKLLIITSLLLLPELSSATTQPLVTIGELEAQQNQNILLQAKVQGAQLQKQLDGSDVDSSMTVPPDAGQLTSSLPSVSGPAQRRPQQNYLLSRKLMAKTSDFMPFSDCPTDDRPVLQPEARSPVQK